MAVSHLKKKRPQRFGRELRAYLPLRIIFISYTIAPLSLCSQVHPRGEVSAVKGIKLSLSVHLHPLCLCRSPRQPASQEYGWLLNVSQLRLLSSSRAMVLAVRQPLTQTPKQRLRSLCLPVYRRAVRCIFECNFNHQHLKCGALALGYMTFAVFSLSAERMIIDRLHFSSLILWPVNSCLWPSSTVFIIFDGLRNALPMFKTPFA